MNSAPTADELPPIPNKERSMLWHEYWRDVVVPQRERQLLAALRENREKNARIAELEAESERYLTQAHNAEGNAVYQTRRAEAAEAKLQEIARILDFAQTNVQRGTGYFSNPNTYNRDSVEAIFARIREVIGK